MKKIIFSIVVLAAIGFGAWKIAHRDGGEAYVPPAKTTSSIAGAVLTAGGDFSYSRETEFISVDAVYPGKTSLQGQADNAARLAMETWIAERTGQFMTVAADELLTSEEQDRLRENGRKYAMGIGFSPFVSPGFVSYMYQIYEDTGGAHPNVYAKTFTFDSDGKQVELSDLFAPGARYLDRLSAFAYKDIVTQLSDRLDVEVTGDIDEWVRLGTAPSPEALQFFYLDAGNLVLVFPPYQVAAYAAGQFEVLVPLVTLVDILKQ